MYRSQRARAPFPALLAWLVAAVVGCAALVAPAALASSSQPSPRIIGGDRAPDYPFVVRLNVTAEDYDLRDTSYCTGVLVAPDVVLTAAHCAGVPIRFGYADMDRIMVFAGGDLRAADAALAAGTPAENAGAIQVSRVIRHPNYTSVDYLDSFDVALLFLERPLPGAPAPIALATAADGPLWAAGTPQRIVGYGSTTPDGAAQSSVPLETTAPIISDADCADSYLDVFNPASMLCARTVGNGPCYGDSGGPLMAMGPAGWVLTGVTSGGGECATGAGVFARVGAPAIRDWLTLQLDAHAGLGGLAGAPLHVFSTPTGNLQARLDGRPEGMFRPGGSNIGTGGFVVQSIGDIEENYGPAFTTSWPIDRAWVPVDAGSVRGSGRPDDPYTRTTEYRTAPDSALTLRVRQTVRYVAGRHGFDADYEVTNTGAFPARFAAAMIAQLQADAANTADAAVSDGAPRLLGVVASTGAFASAMLEVPGASPWSSFTEGRTDQLYSQLQTHGSLTNEVEPQADRPALGARWSDHAEPGSGLAPGASATYRTRWAARAAAPLVLRPSDGNATTGDTVFARVTAQDADGAPQVGVRIAWQIGDRAAHAAVTDSRGTVAFPVTRATAGELPIVAWRDVDADAVADPSEMVRRTTLTFTDTVVRPQQVTFGGLERVGGGTPATLLVTAAQQAAAPGRCHPLVVRLPAGAVVGASVTGGELLFQGDDAPAQTVPLRADGPDWIGTVCARGGILRARLAVAGAADQPTVVVAEIAETPGTGVVVDGPRGPVVGATVRLEQLAGGAWVEPGELGIRPFAASLTTGPGGGFGWQLLPDTTYRVVATRPGQSAISAPFYGADVPPAVDFDPPAPTPVPTPTPVATPPVEPSPPVLPPASPKPPVLLGETVVKPVLLRLQFDRRRRLAVVRVTCASARVCLQAQTVTITLLGRPVKIRVRASKSRKRYLTLHFALTPAQRSRLAKAKVYTLRVRANALGRRGAQATLRVRAGAPAKKP